MIEPRKQGNLQMDDKRKELFQRIKKQDENGWLESEVQIICDTYGLDEIKDRDEIRMIIVQQRLNETR